MAPKINPLPRRFAAMQMVLDPNRSHFTSQKGLRQFPSCGALATFGIALGRGSRRGDYGLRLALREGRFGPSHHP